MDCSFTADKGYFRYRSAAIIVENNSILMAKNDVDDYYYSVGGAVKLHESAEEAVVREVFEETGVKYEIDRALFIHENFFKGFNSDADLKCHEIAIYFLMKPKGDQILNDTGYVYDGVRERMFWLPIDRLDEYKLYPLFFKEELFNITNSIKHIKTEEYNRFE
ncbi:NUDIX domain-containing protein [bacterium]|nr:NUDIX domain-containing protein [bacterium]